ncbi:MAG: hypothetical protein AB2A00_22280 [Myxococcota bacterium]
MNPRVVAPPRAGYTCAHNMRTSAVTGLLLVVTACGPNLSRLGVSSSITGVTLSGSVSDALYKTRVSGVEVCVVEPAEQPCVRTNDVGEFSIPEVPKDARVLLRFIREGYYPNFAEYTTHQADEFLTYALASEDVGLFVANLAGVTHDDANGIVIFGARSGKGPEASNVTEVSVALDPEGGDGPFYATESGFDENATSTTSVGGGSIFNVAPGTYRLRYTHPARTCEPYYAWSAGEPGVIEVKVQAGFSTYVSQICP